MEKYSINYFASKDEVGNRLLLSVGVDGSGIVVAERWQCDRVDCLCVGIWYTGNEKEAKIWYHRPNEIQPEVLSN